MSNFTENIHINQQLAIYQQAVNAGRSGIKDMWRIVAVGNDTILELRALWPKGIPEPKPTIVKHYKVAAYASVEACKAAFECDALALNAKGYNIYTMMNPIDPTFAGGAVKDADISYRDLLLVDIDRSGVTSEPATEDDVLAARALATSIRDYTYGKGWPDPIAVMSGNGYHLYYVLSDVGNDSASAELVKSVLRELAAKFNNEIVSVDTSVHNAARITKVIGTLMRKGMPSESRPYRVAEVCDEL
jgi:hypothetical protein